MTRRRKFWGWGFEDQQPAHEQVEAAAAAAREHLGFGPADVERPARLEELELPPSRLEPPASLAADLPERSVRARRARLREVLPRRGARVPRALRQPARRGGPPGRRGGARARARLVRGGERRGNPVRRRHQRGGRGGAAGRSARGLDRPEAPRPRPRGGPGVARGAHPGGRHRARLSRTSSAATASPCATSRSRSSTRRWAAGSPRARAATTPRSTRTSTTSSSRCAR